ncbi:transcriptional regulator [Massilia sp. Root418]|uniref:winged helix-turn-helix domain-containing protein n=1 Tax=Massilia sp. Root418 TaxID=1736532 RepID=UPI0006F97A74|nr:winged helix-turn-helix domain-containing protein [Massilia sp. Root418]KQW94001.1 transcriptional regulator [Massilia sp. Root418]
METTASAKLRVGAWCVDAALSEMTRDGETVRLEPRMLRLLLCLTARPGEIVSAEELLSQVWPGVVVTPDSVYQAIASLRRLLGDDPKQPRYVVTLPRQGYRMVAEVAPWTASPTPQASLPAAPLPPAVAAAAPAAPGRNRRSWLLAAGAAAVAGAAFWLAETHAGKPPSRAPAQNSVAVLPFADLTDGMGHETFADGMTEELIDRFSKIPGLKVPGPTSSFYYKGKQIAPAGIARELGVSYILDGSVRKSGNTLRVAARLFKADNGFIIWSGTYDKPVDDLLMVQDDIADAVAKALTAAMEKGAAPNPAPRPENRAGKS